MKPICVKCRQFFRPKKNGYYFIEAMPIGNDVPPGNAAPERWQPYKLWSGDLWECRGCGAETIVGTGRHPIAEQHHPDFAEKIAAFGATQFQVNDC